MIRNHRKLIIALLLGCALLLCAGCAAAEKTVTVTFTGDCTLGSEESTRADQYSFDTMAAQKGYDYFFANYRDMFEHDDITFINFEGVLSDSKANEKQTKRYRFRGPSDFVKILTGSSVELAGVANNHTGDYGKNGEESTKQILEENGIRWVQEFNYYLYEKDGVRIAFFALHKSLNTNADKFYKLISALKNNKEVDAIVATWHTGKEYRGAHEAGKYSTESTAKRLIKYGVDLLVMHHPHVIQGVDIADNRCIFYSLGNFVFGGNDEIREEKFLIDKKVTSLYSLVVQAKLTFSDAGAYLGQQVTIYPTYTSSGGILRENIQLNNYQPFRANAEEAVPVRDAIAIDTKGFDLPEITTDENGLSMIELPYLPAFEEVMVPESEDDLAAGPQGIPEASSPAPTRATKDN